MSSYVSLIFKSFIAIIVVHLYMIDRSWHFVFSFFFFYELLLEYLILILWVPFVYFSLVLGSFLRPNMKASTCFASIFF